MQMNVVLNIYIEDPRFEYNKIMYLEYSEKTDKIYAQFFGIPTHYITLKDAKRMLYGSEDADVDRIRVLRDLGEIFKERFRTLLCDFVTNNLFVGFTRVTKKEDGATQ